MPKLIGFRCGGKKWAIGTGETGNRSYDASSGVGFPSVAEHSLPLIEHPERSRSRSRNPIHHLFDDREPLPSVAPSGGVEKRRRGDGNLLSRAQEDVVPVGALDSSMPAKSRHGGVALHEGVVDMMPADCLKIPSIIALCLLGAGASAQIRPPAEPAPKDKAAIYSHADSVKIWRELEEKQAMVRRVAEGGTFSINVRIVRPNDAPLIHGTSADVWVVEDGTAIAVTGGTIANPQRRGQTDDYAGKEIVGATEQKVSHGDIVFVPKGVPHMFKDMKNFHAYLIRFDTP